MNMESFIFLDIDGPINTESNIAKQKAMRRSTSSFHIKLPEEQLYNLETLVHTSGANIVLSSKWRLLDRTRFKGIEVSPARVNLERQLAKYGLYIYDQTPFIDHARGLEITVWLKRFYNQHGYRPPYIILDDSIESVLRAHRGHVIYCDPKYGLTTKLTEIGICLLRTQYNRLLSQRNQSIR